jgi:hypothetical protein
MIWTQWDWLLIGFWGCGVALLISGFFILGSFYEGSFSAIGANLTATIISFIGMCMFGMLLWN